MRCILRQQIYTICAMAMEYRSVKGYNGWAQLSILMVFLGAGFVLTAIIQIIIGMQMVPAGTSLQDLPKALLGAMADPANVNYSRLLQIAGSFALMFIPAFLFNLVVNGRRVWWMGFNNFLNFRQIFIGFLLIFFANMLASPLTDLTKMAVSHFPSLDLYAKALEDEYNSQVAILGKVGSWGEFAVSIIVMAFFPALFEEFLFRGALQNLLVKWWKNAFLGIFISAVIFSLIHWSVYLFISRLILGFILGLMFYQTKNLWVNIIAHFLNNLIAVSQMFYLSRNGKQVDVNNMDPNLNWWGGALALIIIVVFSGMLVKYSKSNVEKIKQKELELLEQHNLFHPF